jgi:hypothetical protein
MPAIFQREKLGVRHGASDELRVRQRHIPIGTPVHHQRRAGDLFERIDRQMGEPV